MNELTLYHCEICGNLICMIEDSGVVPKCCGAEMNRVTANTKDAAAEKHVPVIQREGNSVNIYVGEQPHPMNQMHYIGLIFLLTDSGLYMRRLTPDCAARTVFDIQPDEEIIAVYAWCNIHGLWKS